jgi:hypothetical protein
MPTNRPACIVHTAPDPDQLEVCSHGEVGGFLEVRCETPNYPTFEVVFDGPNPYDCQTGQRFRGSISQPVILALNYEGDFEYVIYHFPAGYENGTEDNGGCEGITVPPPSGPFPCGIIPCRGCR